MVDRPAPLIDRSGAEPIDNWTARSFSRTLACVPLDLTPEERDAVTELLGAKPHDRRDTVDAVSAAIERAATVPAQRGLAIRAARRNGTSVRELARRTGYPESTLRAWGAVTGGGQ